MFNTENIFNIYNIKLLCMFIEIKRFIVCKIINCIKNSLSKKNDGL